MLPLVKVAYNFLQSLVALNVVGAGTVYALFFLGEYTLVSLLVCR